MSSKWEIYWVKSAEKYYKKSNEQKRIQSALIRLKENPTGDVQVKRLVGDLEGCYRCRVGDLRIVYQLDETLKHIVIVYLGPRGDVY